MDVLKSLKECSTYLGDDLDLDLFTFVKPAGSFLHTLIHKATKSSTPSEVALSIIAEIDDNMFFMTADGGWQDNEEWTSKFHSAKASMLANPPSRGNEYESIIDDWDKVVANLKALEKLASRDISYSILKSQSDGPTTIKLIHRIFKRIHHQDREQTVDHDNDMEQWPIRSDYKQFLDEIKETHTINEAPIYDKNHSPLKVQNWDRLKGSIAEIMFSLNYVAIKEKTFINAEIRHVRILEQRLQIMKVESPSKRKLASEASTSKGKRRKQ